MGGAPPVGDADMSQTPMPLAIYRDEERRVRVCPVCFTSALDCTKGQMADSSFKRHYWRCPNGCEEDGRPHVSPIFVPEAQVRGSAEDLASDLARALDEIEYLRRDVERLRRQVDASHEAFLRRYAPEQSEQAHEVAEAQAAEAADVYAEVDWAALR